MIKNILTQFLVFILILPLAFAEDLHNLSAEQLVTMQKENNALVIDIRTEKEWNKTGMIPNSHGLQFYSSFGTYDAEKWLSKLNKLKSSDDQPVILVCASGGRSNVVGNLLAKKLNMDNIYHLSDGIVPWIKSGNKIIKE